MDNGQLVASLTSDGTGAFGTQVQLVSGSNSLVAQVGNACVPTVDSSAVAVTYTPPPPPPPPPNPPVPPSPAPAVVSIANNTNPAIVLPEIIAPTKSLSGAGLTLSLTSVSNGLTTQVGNQMTTASSVFVTGSTGVAANVVVIVNGKVVADILSAKNGNFGVRVPLSVGKNTVQFKAILGDKTVTGSLNITHTVPGAALGLTAPIFYIPLLIVIIFWIGFFFILLARRRKRKEAEERLRQERERMSHAPYSI